MEGKQENLVIPKDAPKNMTVEEVMKRFAPIKLEKRFYSLFGEKTLKEILSIFTDPEIVDLDLLHLTGEVSVDAVIEFRLTSPHYVRLMIRLAKLVGDAVAQLMGKNGRLEKWLNDDNVVCRPDHDGGVVSMVPVYNEGVDVMRDTPVGALCMMRDFFPDISRKIYKDRWTIQSQLCQHFEFLMTSEIYKCIVVATSRFADEKGLMQLGAFLEYLNTHSDEFDHSGLGYSVLVADE